MQNLALHPALVHLPLGLAALLPLLLFALFVAIRRGWLPARTWWIAIGVCALTAGGALASLASGERDEHRAERTAGKGSVEAHEHAAQRFTVAAGAVLGLALAGALVRSRPLRSSAHAAALIGAVASLALAVDTGRRGGALVHEQGVTAGARAAPPMRAAGRSHDH